MDYSVSNHELDYEPDDTIVISGAREIELMQKLQLRKKGKQKE